MGVRRQVPQRVQRHDERHVSLNEVLKVARSAASRVLGRDDPDAVDEVVKEVSARVMGPDPPVRKNVLGWAWGEARTLAQRELRRRHRFVGAAEDRNWDPRTGRGKTGWCWHRMLIHSAGWRPQNFAPPPVD